MPPLEEKKHERFAREYVIDHNATQAAIRAGYSEKTARSQGSRLLTYDNIAARVAELEDQLAARLTKKTEMDREWVLQKYRSMVEFDPRKLFTEDGKMRDITQLDDETALAIQAFDMDFHVHEETDDGGKKTGEKSTYQFVDKIKIAEKKGALDSIAKILGLFVDKQEHSGPNGKPIEVKEISDKELARQVAFHLTRGVKQEEDT